MVPTTDSYQVRETKLRQYLSTFLTQVSKLLNISLGTITHVYLEEN